MARGKKQVEQPDTTTVDLVSRGEDAKRLFEMEYFKDICTRMEETYKSEVLNLHPSNTARFSAIQERRQGLIDLRGSIVADIEAGRKALAQAQGEHSKGRVA